MVMITLFSVSVTFSLGNVNYEKKKTKKNKQENFMTFHVNGDNFKAMHKHVFWEKFGKYHHFFIY